VNLFLCSCGATVAFNDRLFMFANDSPPDKFSGHRRGANGENKMRSVVLVASLICGLLIPELASAMPMAPSDTVVKSTNHNVVQVAGGCGPRKHRGPHGGCRWN
jgi:hypothetical protein